MVRFADILTIVNGKNQKKVENPNGKYPIYGSGGVIGYADDYICEAETVVIGRKGNINNPIFVDTPFWNVDTAFGLCPNHSKLYPKYLYYFCINHDFERINTTVTIPSLTKANLLNVEIPLPPLDEQRRIAAVLDKVSGLIAKRRQQLEMLDELVKARFVEMFGDPVSNPHKWQKVALSDVAAVHIGPFGSLLHKDDYITGGHPLVNPSHILDGKIIIDEKLTVSKEKYDELEPYHLKVGDVIMARRGEMGRCAVVQREGLICGTGSLLIRTKGSIMAEYIQKILSFPTFKKTIEDLAVGQTMQNLNVSIVSNFQIINPPLQMQKDYYSYLTQTETTKTTIIHSLGKLETLKKSLMQEYFR